MAKSIALPADASRLASLLLSYVQAVCAFVAPSQPGASTGIIDRLSHSRALSTNAVRIRERTAESPRAPKDYLASSSSAHSGRFITFNLPSLAEASTCCVDSSCSLGVAGLV